MHLSRIHVRTIDLAVCRKSVFADASCWTDDSYAFAFELLEKAGVGMAPGVDFGQAGKRAVRFSYDSSAVEREVV